MNERLPNIAIIGLGLIGSSIALSTKRTGAAANIVGFDKSAEVRAEAKQIGLPITLVDDIKLAVVDADIVFLAVPVGVMAQVVQQIILHLKSGAILTDTGSTKRSIIDDINPLLTGNIFFVPGHPLAGTEFSGPEAAQLGLFEGKINIICDKGESSKEAVEKISELYHILGMENIYMNAQDHDIHSAYVSHISHISSFCLALSVMDKEKDEKNILNMAGSGFESTVRLAKSNKEMWTPIFTENKSNILAVLNDYIEKLNSFKSAIQEDNNEKINALILQANGIKKILK